MRKRLLSKILVVAVCASMCVTMVGCTNNKKNEGGNQQSINANNGETVGQTLLAAFKDKAKDTNASAQDVADALLANPVLDFAGASMNVPEGMLIGFDNAQIKGFKDGVQFSPMIGAIPFIGYVFTLDEGTDADAFMKNLKDNANPRWNVCTEADETVVEKAGDKVLFLMCPKNFDEVQ